MPNPTNPYGRDWRRVRAEVLAMSDVCGLCGHDGTDSVDHIMPLSRVGERLALRNLRPAHYRPCRTCGVRCNTARGNRDDAAPRPARRTAWACTRRGTVVCPEHGHGHNSRDW
jgi:5-methylcytosine-specific restriction endonuclease McrA